MNSSNWTKSIQPSLNHQYDSSLFNWRKRLLKKPQHLNDLASIFNPKTVLKAKRCQQNRQYAQTHLSGANRM